MRRRTRCLAWALLLAGLAVGAAQGQDYGARLGTVKRGGRVTYEPTGPGVMFDALDPALRKWYVPQELYTEYQWRQWEYSNYARENYQRYVSTSLEGDYWYDVYGNLLTRGWLVYDWRQENPAPFGSLVEKTGRFSQWFSSLAIASDHKGQYHFALTVGNAIRTTLTPMTFSKPAFNGLQWDFQSDKHSLTLLMSRISEPNSPGSVPSGQTSNTNFFGSRLETQVGDFVKVGGTFVSAHHSVTQLDAVNGDIFSGALAEGQNVGSVNRITVRIGDESPEDAGGGALFSSDLIIHDDEGQSVRASELSFRPLTEGGFQRRGYLAADGNEEILVTYDFADRTYSGPDPTAIRRVEVELVLANDYAVDVASDRQRASLGEVVFLPLARARGNVKDGSNQRVLRFDYGVPTANQITGFTLELTDLQGTEGYLEVNVNHRYRKYPNPNFKRHRGQRDRALGWFLNLARDDYPYYAFLEAFGMDPEYSTSFVTVDDEGIPDYGNDFQLFEFVEDNDDLDREPDWRRKGSGAGDREVFPGLDENNDRIWDFNQNDNEDRPNLVPDWEEPFLRFFADRPEFLYGIDANHNGTVDRFENDTEPDYPYRRGQVGHNAYGGFFLGPDARLTIGRLRVEERTSGHHNRAVYGLLTVDHKRTNWGRMRWFQDVRKVKDTIADDLLQWQQPASTRGSLQRVEDQLPARNTWISTTWLGLDQRPVAGLRLEHKAKWQLWRQLDEDLELELRGQRSSASFFGLVNKGEYGWYVGQWQLEPRIKSEWRRQTPLRRAEPKRHELTQLLMLVVGHPIMQQSYLEGGIEYERFFQLEKPVPPGADPSFTGWTTTLQLRNLSDYLGYRLTTTLGFEITRLDMAFEAAQLRTRSFITMYAGVER